jgi:putative endonuclease
MSWFVYVLRSERDGRFYIGMSENPQARLSQHNAGMTRSTKPYRPYCLVYQKECKTRVAARALEKKYKSGSGREMLKKIVL